jgi:hypothetical protein
VNEWLLWSNLDGLIWRDFDGCFKWNPNLILG